MTRILTLSILFTSALSAVQASSVLFPRQEESTTTSTSTSPASSSSSSLEQAYTAIEQFATEVTTRISNGECTKDGECGGWMQSALACVSDGGGSTDETELAKCACQDEFQKSFASCVSCVGTDSAKQSGEALSSVCSSSSNNNNDSSTLTAGDAATTSTTNSTSTTTSPPSSSTSSRSGGGGGATESPAGAGSGVDRLGMNRFAVGLATVGTGFVAFSVFV